MKTHPTQNPQTRSTASKSFTPIALACALAFGGSALAGDWTGGTSTDWNTGANWSDSNVPNGGGAVINTTNGNLATISANVSGTPTEIVIGGWGSVGRVNHTAGSLTTQTGGWPPGWLLVGFGINGNGTYNLADTTTTGGTFTGFGTGSGTLNVGDYVHLGEPFGDGTFTGNSVLNINTTGALNISGWLQGGNNFYSSTVNMDAGTVSVGGELWVAKNGTGTFNQSGGTVRVPSWTVLSRYNSASATYNLTGGTVNAATNGGNLVLVSEGGTGVFNVSGGNLNVPNSDIWVCENYDGGSASGALNISGTANVSVRWWVWLTRWNSGAGALGTLNLNGGTLETEHVANDAGTGIVNFNGGTLKTKAGGDFLTGTMTVNVLDGGAVVDTAGNDPTISKSLLTGGTGLGGLTKNGNGILYLTAANTFSGPVVVNGGTLYPQSGYAANGRTFSYVSSITVNSNATLKTLNNGLFGWDGSQAKPITVNAGGTAIVDGSGDVNVGQVTLNGGTLAGGDTDDGWGSWSFGRAATNVLAATDNSTVTATNVGLFNGASINVAAGKTLTFSGTIVDTFNGPSAVIKSGGNGTLTISGANTYTGSTLISNGTVLVNGSLASGSAVAVNGGTLGGTGTVGGAVTVNSGGTLAPGASIGTLILGSLTLNSGATAAMEIGNGPSGDEASASGAVAYAGTLRLIWTGTTPSAGTVDLFDGSGFSGAFSSLQVSNWPSAYRVNTNNLTTDGSITIAANAAPEAKNLTLGVAQGGSASLPIIGGKNGPTDGDGDAMSVTSVALVTPANGGNVSIVGGTSVVYTASASFSGTDSFTYTVSDLFGATDTKTVTVNVSPAGTGANITGISGSSPTIGVQAQGVPNAVYQLQYTTNLTTVNWVDVSGAGGTATAGALTGAMSFTDVNATNVSAWYRTRHVSGP